MTTSTVAAQKRRVYKTIFCLGAAMVVASLIVAGLIGLTAAMCAVGTLVGGNWILLVLFIASEDDGAS